MAKQAAGAREGVQILGLLRAGIGAALFTFPGLSARVWLGEGARGPTARIAMRALGAREVVLGIGLLTALEGRRDPETWIEAGALCDVADTYLMATSRGVPLPRRIASIASTAGAVYWALRLADELE